MLNKSEYFEPIDPDEKNDEFIAIESKSFFKACAEIKPQLVILDVMLPDFDGLSVLEKLRKDVPIEFDGLKILSARDYREDVIKDMVTGKTTNTGLPKSNVLYYDLEDDVWVCIRPSGTEPKLKFYYGVKGTSFEDAQEKLDKLGKYLLNMVNSML